MATRGRKPKPDAVRRAEKGKEAAPPVDESIVNPFDMTCPAYLDKYGREEWNRVVGYLTQRGIIASVDYSLLAQYCDWHSVYRRARKELGNGKLMAGQAYRQEANLMSMAGKNLRALASEMGLTPTSRARLLLPGNGEGKGEGNGEDWRNTGLDE